MKKNTFINVVLIGLIVVAGASILASQTDIFNKLIGKDEPKEENVILGVSWDRTESTALTRLTSKNDDLVTYDVKTEAVAGIGSSKGFSEFDNLYPYNEMKEYNVVDNEIKYSREDKLFSLTEYDVVVHIPTFYYKVVSTEEKVNYYISNQKVDGFEKHPGSNKYVAKYNTSASYLSVSGVDPLTNITRAEVRENAKAKGDNWSQYDFATWNAIQMLYLVEYADFDVQAKIGRGIVDTAKLGYDTKFLPTGGCDSMAYHTGRAEGEDGYTQVQYRYIEGLWGNVCEWVDGINMNEREVFISLDHKKYADDTDEGYTSTGVTLPSTGKITGLGYSEKYSWAIIPNQSVVDADYTIPQYVPDKVCSGSGWRILYTSNNADGDSLAGLFRFSTSSASTRIHETYGCRLVFHGE